MFDLLPKTADCIRLLSVDGVEKAESGHPGMPMGIADIAYVLWQRHLRFNPEEPNWINRDRFILSAGHGSMLLYSLLHLYGYDLPLSELKNFRQWESKTPGHPEYGHTPGVETTTGPLGQGFANGVGMAIGYEILRKKLSMDGYGKAQRSSAGMAVSAEYSPLNHKIYVIASDGDMMEGLSSEAASLAGHLNLSNLIVIYDDNRITIDGSTELSFSEDVEKRFMSYGWDVYRMDGHNLKEIDKTLRVAREKNNGPTLIIAGTRIGRGSVNLEGSHKTHGVPLGEDEIVQIKRKMGFPENEHFYIPKDVKVHTEKRVRELKTEYEKWVKEFDKYLSDNPDIGKDYEKYLRKQTIDHQELLAIDFKEDKLATRKASNIVMQHVAGRIPNLLGGSSDLASSNKTTLKAHSSFTKDERSGRNLHFGIREHAMGATLNGLALYGRFIPFGATFLVFSDYMRPAMRMAALMGLHIIYVFTHDSIFVGEDGPTHQPVEHLWSLRTIPNLDIIRPADAKETAIAWAQAINNDRNPTVLILTRQGLPVLDKTRYAPAENLTKGAYIISPERDRKGLDIILIATGSEVSLTLEAQERLEEDGLSVRVVSMPSVELFERQAQDYKEMVLPGSCTRRVAIEAGISGGWHRYVGREGLVLGIDGFGASAPVGVLTEKYGFTVDKVCGRIKDKFKV